MQKADFGGGAMGYAIAFSIAGKGYLGTGTDINYPVLRKDFWEYDPVADAWEQKSDFGGTSRIYAVGFSIKDLGYAGTGKDTNGDKKDFWAYDPSTDTWTQKADFGGTARWWATGFATGDMGYLGTGSGLVPTTDFWAYDPTADSWTQKEDFEGVARNDAFGFAIGNKGYIGFGNGGSYLSDLWEYTPDGIPTAIAGHHKEETYLEVFPNPINEQTIVRLHTIELPDEHLTMQLSAMNGQLLYTLPVINGMVTLQHINLSPGIYLCEVSSSSRIIATVRIAKK